MKSFFPAFLFLFLFTTNAFAQAPSTGQWFAPACKPKTYGLKNSSGAVAAEAKFDMLEEGDGKGWIAYSAGKYGVINSSGAWIIKPGFELIVQYLNGRAVAGKKAKTKTQVRYDEVYSYREEKTNDSTFYLGVVDASGVWVVDPVYDFLRLSEDGSIQYADADDHLGFLNADGSVMLRAQYEYASQMNGGVAVIGESVMADDARYIYGRQRFRAGNYFVIDRNGTKLNAQPYPLIREFKEGRAAFNKDGSWKSRNRYDENQRLVGGKWGFLDASGKEIIPATYDYVYDFVKGKAKVRLEQRIFWIDKDGKETTAPLPENTEKEFTVFCSPGFFGYIGLDGKYVIEPQYFIAKEFSEGLAAVMPLRASDLDCDNLPGENSERYKTEHRHYSSMLNTVFDLDRDYGVNYNMEYAARKIQDSLRVADSLAYIFSRSVRLYGYADKTGNLVLPAKYEIALPFHNGRAYVLYHEKWGVIDTKGKWIFEPVLEWADELRADKEEPENGIAYYRYDSGNEIIWKRSSSVYRFSEGMGAIMKYEKFGFIDSTGKIIAAPVYDEVKPFSNGLAAVRHGDYWGYIDKTGKEVLPLIYRTAESFTAEGLACVSAAPKSSGNEEADRAMGYENDESRYYGYIDKKGNWAIKPQFTDAGNFSNGLAAVSLNYETSGYIDKSGKFVIPPKYNYAGNFEYGFAVVRINTYDAVYIDKTGKVSKAFTPENPPQDTAIPLRPVYGASFYFGFVNPKGEVIIPHEFSEVGNFSLVK